MPSPAVTDPSSRYHVDGPRPSQPIGIAVLGATGSVGRQTLDVIAAHPDRFRVVALTGGRNLDLLAAQARVYRPDLVSVAEPAAATDQFSCQVEVGEAGLIAAATHPDADIVVVATSGHAAIAATFHAVAASKTIALANKEAIVCAGELLIPLAKSQGVEIRPIDSEHSAIWQSLGRASVREVRRLILTASGGPFRDTPLDQLADVTVAQALAHPTWAMGGKITIDSATLMNKGLEILEARWLFGVPLDQIEILIHPESIVHSLVDFVDGSQIAQLSLPDMRLPIQYALTYPEHVASPCTALSLADIGTLRFFPHDDARFPAPTLARQVGNAGSTYPTVLSAADDEAVAAFLAGAIRFPAIIAIVSAVLDAHQAPPRFSREAIVDADRWARDAARAAITRRGSS